MGDNIKKIGIRNDSGEYTYTDIGVDADKVDIDNTTLDQKISTIEEDITKKVDKVEGKGLSSNDFTDEHLSIVETMSTGIVTGIKGNAEDDYRTGDVNLMAENIGALPVDGTAKKATADANGNVIPDTYATKDELTDSNDTLASDIALNRQTLGYSKKNLLKNTATSTTNNGVTFTVNDDGSVTVNGTATASAYFETDANFVPIQNGKYILSGCPSGGSSTTFYLALYDNTILSTIVKDVGLSKDVELDITHTYKPTISVLSGTTVENLTFYPMIHSADITDDTYEPYVDDVDTRLQKIDNSILNTLEEIDANTSEGNIAGALALKEVNSRLKSFGNTFAITKQGTTDCFELTGTDVYLCVTFVAAPGPTQANLYIAIGSPSGSLLVKVTEDSDNIKLQLSDNMLQLVSVYGNVGYVEIINFRHWKQKN